MQLKAGSSTNKNRLAWKEAREILKADGIPAKLVIGDDGVVYLEINSNHYIVHFSKRGAFPCVTDTSMATMEEGDRILMYCHEVEQYQAFIAVQGKTRMVWAYTDL